MVAPSKDDVYAALRKNGIRAIRVTERVAPVVRKGFAGLRKRDLCVLALAAGVISGVAYFVAPRETGRVPETKDAAECSFAPALPRRQIGDVGELDLAVIFENSSERFLSRYVSPGSPLTEQDRPLDLAENLLSCLKKPIVVLRTDSENVIVLKRVVAGLKEEVSLLIAGGHSINDVLSWLDERQKMEAAHRERIVANCRRGVMKREDANRLLRTMGLLEIGENSR